jgi:ABC-type glycerol-3-phosphate transport system substrate-binding protein
MFAQELVQYPYSVTLANGGEFLKINNNTVKENLTDPKLVNGLRMFQEMTHGNKKIVSDKGGFQNTDPFISGNVYMYFGDGFQWQSLEPLVKGSNAFGKNSANLGFVPIPFGPDNTKKVYPIHAFQGWCAGNGTSDARAAIAWAMFDSTYTDPVGDTRTADFKAMWNAILDSGKIVAPYTGFASPGGSSDSIALDIAKQVSEGTNIAQLLTAYRDLMQEAIDYNVK